MDVKEIINIKDITDIKNYNFKTILSILSFIAGVIFYISWGLIYGVWVDIGIYSITIVLVLGGILGFLISINEEKEEE